MYVAFKIKTPYSVWIASARYKCLPELNAVYGKFHVIINLSQKTFKVDKEKQGRVLLWTKGLVIMTRFHNKAFWFYRYQIYWIRFLRQNPDMHWTWITAVLDDRLLSQQSPSPMYRVAFLWTTFVTKVQHDLHLFKLAKLHFSMSMYWNLNCFPVCLYKILARKKGNSLNEACLKLNNEYLQIIRRLYLNLITAYIKKPS